MPASDNATPHKAAEYDKSVRQTIPFYETIQSEVVDLVRIVKPDVDCWLDTGCGTGYLVEIAMSHFPRTSFVLTDPSESMLKQAITRLRGQPEGRVRFLPPISSQNLSVYLNKLHPQVITAVLSHHYLHKPQRHEATQICHQLLDESGVFVTVENINPGTEEAISSGLERWKHFQIEHGRPKSIAEEHAKRFNSEYFPISVEEHISLLREIGFKVVNLFWMSHMQAGFYAIK
ncbi:MAG: class I SAM-dependent methyltransferase [Dehalococcoidia bacterium]|nr:class I SAM-dependent methyltransferase [Dehalococcoidia bacterium]